MLALLRKTKNGGGYIFERAAERTFQIGSLFSLYAFEECGRTSGSLYKRRTTREYYFYAAVNCSCRDNLLVFLTSWGRSCQFFLAGLFSSFISPVIVSFPPWMACRNQVALQKLFRSEPLEILELVYRKAWRKMIMKPQSRSLKWTPYKY